MTNSNDKKLLKDLLKAVKELTGVLKKTDFKKLFFHCHPPTLNLLLKLILYS